MRFCYRILKALDLMSGAFFIGFYNLLSLLIPLYVGVSFFVWELFSCKDYGDYMDLLDLSFWGVFFSLLVIKVVVGYFKAKAEKNKQNRLESYRQFEREIDKVIGVSERMLNIQISQIDSIIAMYKDKDFGVDEDASPVVREMFHEMFEERNLRAVEILCEFRNSLLFEFYDLKKSRNYEEISKFVDGLPGRLEKVGYQCESI